MRNASKAVVVQTVGTLFRLGTTGEWSDGDLLDRLVSREDETRSAAFEVLVDRHGPMVLDVCRNVLRDDHEAEDAFQATFLILARQARSIRQRGSVGSWLFGVATRVASRARVDAARRRARERAFAQDAAARAPSNSDAAAKAALHEEIAQLPERYREPIVLCYLEGMSYQAAAERLGCLIGRIRWGHPPSGNKKMWMAPFVAFRRRRFSGFGVGCGFAIWGPLSGARTG